MIFLFLRIIKICVLKMENLLKRIKFKLIIFSIVFFELVINKYYRIGYDGG